ncbi:MAG: hypothetical protein ACM3S1_13295 [Hyphomicrobiales bacterium]
MTAQGTGPRLQAGDQLPPYRVRAHNASTQSENKIHDDTVAKQYGFAGGLVPGVTVFAYMTRPVVEAFGPEWLERGRMDARFLKPFYEGEQATVSATVREVGTDGPVLELVATNESGATCAVGSAGWLPADSVAPSAAFYSDRPLPSPRPGAAAEWFRANRELGSLHETWSAGESNETFLAEIADDLELWRGLQATAHPGYLIRKANSILASNVLLGPWIHVSSDVAYLGLLHDGDPMITRGRVTDVFERKGHEFVELDVVVFGRDDQPVMRATHTAIYRPRKVG